MLSGLKKNTRPIYILPKTLASDVEYIQTENKGMEEITSHKWEPKEKCSNYTHIRQRDTEVIIKGSVHQGYIIIVSICPPNIRAPKCVKQI